MSGPFDDLTEAQRRQIREAHAANKQREAHCNHDAPAVRDGVCECGTVVGTVTGLPAILRALNDYERAHSPQAMAYDPENIWRDVICRLPSYDAERTEGFTDVSRFALTDGTIISWDPARPFTGPWGVEDPDDVACGQADETGEDEAR